MEYLVYMKNGVIIPVELDVKIDWADEKYENFFSQIFRGEAGRVRLGDGFFKGDEIIAIMEVK